ncbi:hypothetical protein VNO77_22767 [Canavalia gladiata]|uniref:Uncharacterized protein n=1 Tax=Canavalia gladiata TaxID=3824 RepID=A0AAN9QES3_CANGL
MRKKLCVIGRKIGEILRRMGCNFKSWHENLTLPSTLRGVHPGVIGVLVDRAGWLEVLRCGVLDEIDHQRAEQGRALQTMVARIGRSRGLGTSKETSNAPYLCIRAVAGIRCMLKTLEAPICTLHGPLGKTYTHVVGHILPSLTLGRVSRYRNLVWLEPDSVSTYPSLLCALDRVATSS